MRTLLVLLIASILGLAQQPPVKPYTRFQPEKLLIPPDPEKGTGPRFNVGYLDLWIAELSVHAKNYPVRFSSDEDKKLAYRDVELLSKQLDILNEPLEPNAEFLRRAGFVNSMAHNLDVPGAANRANDYFQRLLKVAPDDPAGNYMYGAFLGGAGKSAAAIPYLLKADSLGILNASYSLGMTYLMTGDKEKSIEYFEKYLKLVPEDKSVPRFIEAIKAGRVGTKHVDGKS
jgi:tetratricopeptide (TPR) repeat protein